MIFIFRLKLKYESFSCKDKHHKECIFTATLRDELVQKFANISYNEQWNAIHEAFKFASRKKKEKKHIYCGVRLKQKNTDEELERVTELFERESRKKETCRTNCKLLL